MPVSRPSSPFAFIENDAPLMDFRRLLPERLFEKRDRVIKIQRKRLRALLSRMRASTLRGKSESADEGCPERQETAGSYRFLIHLVCF